MSAWAAPGITWGLDQYRSHFGSRYTLGCCSHAGLFTRLFVLIKHMYQFSQAWDVIRRDSRSMSNRPYHECNVIDFLQMSRTWGSGFVLHFACCIYILTTLTCWRSNHCIIIPDRHEMQNKDHRHRCEYYSMAKFHPITWSSSELVTNCRLSNQCHSSGIFIKRLLLWKLRIDKIRDWWDS